MSRTRDDFIGADGVLKQLAAQLPISVQQELKRIRFRLQIWRDKFRTREPEFALLDSWISKDDWVIDVGANVGHYTLRMAHIVGDDGRVIAFEPIPLTFELLACNVAAGGCNNVTLMNAALSEKSAVGTMTIPKFDNGLHNFYEAKLSPQEGGFAVICVPLDSLGIERSIKLIKIDAEGHEASVLRGMLQLLERDKPVLIIEGISPEVTRILAPFGYLNRSLAGSPNKIYYH